MAVKTYFLPDELCHLVGEGHRISLKCFHLNAQSARGKVAQLEVLFEQFNFSYDLIILTETWYTADSDVLHLPGYKSFFLNRKSGRGGGVAILVKENIDCEVVERFSCITNDYEVLTLSTDKYIFAAVYRPPHGNCSNFYGFLETLLSYVTDNMYHVLIGGDININMLGESTRKRELDLLIEMNGCMNAITVPTRITDKSESLIDIFITNFTSSRVIAGALSYDIGDHLPIFLCVTGLELNRRSSKNRVLFQKVTLENLEQFKSDLLNEGWDDVYEQDDANEAYNIFINRFQHFYQKHFPIKEIKISKKIRKPWINRSLLAAIQMKNKLYKKFINTKNEDDLNIFKHFRNQLTREIRVARERYHNASFRASAGHSDVLWKKINLALNRKAMPDSIKKIVSNGMELSGVPLSNAFNEFFVNLVSKSTHDNDVFKYIALRNTDSIFFDPVNDNDIVRIFMELKNSSSCDADGIQIGPVKHVISIIAPCIAYIFNICLHTGVFPQKMQVAKVSVLYKKGDKNDFNNYRPVSILPVFSKALEKVIHCRLTSFLDKNNIITDSQFGFRKGRSTELALLQQKDYILQAFEERKIVLGVFIDYTKAFDYLNHKVLLGKLEIYGIRGVALQLISSYLGHRRQYVCLNGFSSTINPIFSGVPQGSILGPTLFNLYINDIVNISQPTKFIIYADDTSLFFSGENCNALIKQANNVLSSLEKWTKCNMLTINPNKTKAVIFRSRNKHVIQTDQVVFGGTQIEVVNSIKTLGVHFTEHMSWENHINYMVTKLSQIIGSTCRSRYLLPKCAKMIIYNSLFLSCLSYCTLVWGSTTSTNIHKLSLLQKKNGAYYLQRALYIPYRTIV